MNSYFNVALWNYKYFQIGNKDAKEVGKKKEWREKRKNQVWKQAGAVLDGIPFGWQTVHERKLCA